MSVTSGNPSPHSPLVKMRPDRPGRVRGLAARRMADGIDGTLMAASDPVEHRVLEQLHDRAAKLARRASGVRGLFR